MQKKRYPIDIIIIVFLVLITFVSVFILSQYDTNQKAVASDSGTSLNSIDEDRTSSLIFQVEDKELNPELFDNSDLLKSKIPLDKFKDENSGKNYIKVHDGQTLKLRIPTKLEYSFNLRLIGIISEDLNIDVSVNGYVKSFKNPSGNLIEIKNVSELKPGVVLITVNEGEFNLDYIEIINNLY